MRLPGRGREEEVEMEEEQKEEEEEEVLKQDSSITVARRARTLARAQSGTQSLFARSRSISCHWSQVALTKCQGERPTTIKHHLVTGSLFSSTGENKIIKKNLIVFSRKNNQ